MKRFALITASNLILSSWVLVLQEVSCPFTSKRGECPIQKSDNLGLQTSNLHVHGIAFGVIPAFMEPIQPNTPIQINAKLPRPIAIMGDYVELGTNAEGLKKIDWHVETLQNLAGQPVYQIALMPNHGLKSLSRSVINRIAAKMEDINRQNVTVWLRFAHEMNGSWYTWGMQPGLFKIKWRHLTQAVRRRAPNTYMMWAPNAKFGRTVHSLNGGYTPYWPGSQYVDIAALSYYHFGGTRRYNVVPSSGEAIGKLKEFAQLYGFEGKGKPIVLAETAAPYTRSISSHSPEKGGGSEREIKLNWLKQLFSENMQDAVPELRAISWFEIVKNEKGPGRTYNKREDFRLIMGDRAVSDEALDYLRGSGDYQEKMK